MSLRRHLQDLFSKIFKQNPAKTERRYDNVQIKSAVDGTTIKGHEAVTAYLEREKKLAQEHGSVIVFQVYRINLLAETIEQLQSEKLAEVKVDGSFVLGTDTVAIVKEKVRSLLKENGSIQHVEGTKNHFTIKDAENITLYFGGRPMQDTTLFYADNFVMLPAWVQILLHTCEFDEVISLVNKLNTL